VIEATIQIRIENWVDIIRSKYDVRIKIMDVYSSENGVGNLVEIYGSEEDLERIPEELKKLKYVIEFDLQKTKKGTLSGSVIVSHCRICEAISEGEIFLIGAETKDDGSFVWKVLSSNKKNISKVIENLNKVQEAKLLSISHLSPTDVLTSRQEEILRIALERGYFDHPRRVTLKELAKMLGVSPSTLSEIIKRGEKRILERYFKY